VVTAFADNEVGRLLEDLVLQGASTRPDPWVPYDGIGRAVRNGLNFTERGFGVRGAVGASDRGHTAASQLRPDDVDWEHLFGTLGRRWLHTGGIYAALSETTRARRRRDAAARARHGTVVSYDLNYRPSLWKAVGGAERAREVNRRLAGLRRRDDRQRGGLHRLPRLRGAGHRREPRRPRRRELPAHDRDGDAEYTELPVVATTLRTVRSATVNDWGAIAWADGGFVEATHRTGLEILDRVGGGDSFASGLILRAAHGRRPADGRRVRRRTRRARDDQRRGIPPWRRCGRSRR
jgi:2-dehydro-3-deoxygluconokinase